MSGEDRVKQVMASSKCDVCGQCYEEDDIHIIGYIGDTCILQVYCRACHSQTLLAASIDESDSNRNAKDGDLTDLMPAEEETFKNTIITANDVLDMHIYLASRVGNFSQLMREKNN